MPPGAMAEHSCGSGKNIVICSDGTGNDYTGTPSNVRRLYEWIERNGPRQIACYHPGIGTHPLPQGRTGLGRRLRHARELGFGAGVIDTVASLYSFLMQQYEQGDRIYLFGFSRGAFTVRALAGLVHTCGLLRRDDAHLVSFAAGLYQTAESRIKRERKRRGLPDTFGPVETRDHVQFDREACDFKSLVSRPCAIQFLGIWDTVKAYGWLYPRSFPALRHNPSVEGVRHAVAADERRALFKVTGWGDRHAGVKEVWFAGDHSDVGGGHPCGNTALADVTLRWMLGEATQAGLQLDDTCKDPITKLDAADDVAPSTEPHDLSSRKGFWFLDRGPRVELFNAVYPPRRRPRLFWADGARKPSDHDEDDAGLRFHTTLLARAARDPRCEPAALAPGVRVEPEENLEIQWSPKNRC